MILLTQNLCLEYLDPFPTIIYLPYWILGCMKSSSYSLQLMQTENDPIEFPPCKDLRQVFQSQTNLQTNLTQIQNELMRPNELEMNLQL